MKLFNEILLSTSTSSVGTQEVAHLQRDPTTVETASAALCPRRCKAVLCAVGPGAG